MEQGKSDNFKSFSDNESNANNFQKENRSELVKLFKEFKVSEEELMSQFGLFIRSSYLVKFLVLNDLYERIINVPGKIFEFGTRFGHNLVVFENLRAIYEPFNKTREIVGFDTFEGYKNFTEIDKESNVFVEETYQVFNNYEKYINKLLITHEKCNVMGHLFGNHQVIKGDVTLTVKDYLKEPSTVVALAYFDMGLYKPTKIALEQIKPHLIPGSVILLDEFTWSESQESQLHSEKFLVTKAIKLKNLNLLQ